MKNISKNNYSKKNRDKTTRRSQSKSNFKSNNFQDEKLNSGKNNFYGRNNFKQKDDYRNRDDFQKRDNKKTNENIYLNPKDKTKNSFNQPNRRFSTNKSNNVNNFDKSQKISYLKTPDKSFDDWIWGKHSVLAALKSERPINRIWCTPEVFSSEKFFLLLKDLKSKGVLIEEVSWSRLSQLTFGAVHQGIALQLSASQTLSLETLISRSKSNSTNPIFVALDGITDPHNLGAIIRSAEAFDCKGIIIPQRRSAGLTGTVAKVAAGALEHIPVSRVINLNRGLDLLKKNGFLILGLAGDGKVPISEFDQKLPMVVVVGSENKGISLLTQKKCDYLLKIPLKGKTSSLNASVAAAISIHYLSRN